MTLKGSDAVEYIKNPVVVTALTNALAGTIGNGVDPDRVVELSLAFDPERSQRFFGPLSLTAGHLTADYKIIIPSSACAKIIPVVSKLPASALQSAISSRLDEVGWRVAGGSTHSFTVLILSTPSCMQS